MHFYFEKYSKYNCFLNRLKKPKIPAVTESRLSKFEGNVFFEDLSTIRSKNSTF